VDARKESVGEESPSTDPGETVDNPLLGLGTGFELTAQDIYFFQEVEEPMRWIIRVMCWINLAACALRFASFVIAELPVVLHLGLKNKEEEEAENQQHVDEGQEEEQEYDKEKDVPPLLQLDDWKPPAENANSQEVPPTDEDSKVSSQGEWRRALLDGVSVVLTSERTVYEMLCIIFAALAVVTTSLLSPYVRSSVGDVAEAHCVCVCVCMCVRACARPQCLFVLVLFNVPSRRHSHFWQISASGQAFPLYQMPLGTAPAKWARPSCLDCYACTSEW
jgi:hypothetical protein